MPQTIVSIMGRLSRKCNSFRVMEKTVRKKTERDIWREVGWFGDEGRHQLCPSQKLRHLLAIVCPY
jgi:hypothetical protein